MEALKILTLRKDSHKSLLLQGSKAASYLVGFLSDTPSQSMTLQGQFTKCKVIFPFPSPLAVIVGLCET